MSFRHVFRGQAPDPGTHGGTTSAISTTGATLLVVGFYDEQYAATACTVSDSLGNLWETVIGYGSASPSFTGFTYSWHSISGGLIVGAVDTIIWNCPSTYRAAVTFVAYSGTKTSADPFDQYTGAGTTGYVASLATGSITPSTNGQLIVAFAGVYNGQTYGINDGFTAYIYTDSNDNTHSTGQAWLAQGTAAAINPTWSTGSVNQFSAAIASFKAP